MRFILLAAQRASGLLIILFTFMLHTALGAGPAGAAESRSGGPDEIGLLRRQVEAQQEQIDQLRRQMEEQRKTLEMMSRWLTVNASPDAAAIPRHDVQVASLVPVVATESRVTTLQSQSGTEIRSAQKAAEPQPLSFGIGSVQITPVGWIDLTAYARKGNVGSGLGTNFAAVPFDDTVNGNLHETRLTAQGTRMGFRLDAPVRGARLLGYLETDFNGFSPGNAAVTSNSNSLRVRLAWVELGYRKLSVLGGQSWSLLTPNRKGLSPLPADVFSGMQIDPNHHVGLPWGRVPQFRLTYRPASTFSMGLSLESPEQYIGGSAGAGTTTLPSQLAVLYAGQLNNGVTNFSTPTASPDVIAKVAVDRSAGGRPLHFEAAGLLRRFRVHNPLTSTSFGSTGGAGSANLSFEPVKNLRFLFNSLYSDGGGRYLFGLGPDLIIQGDGSPSLVRAYSTIDGFEFQAGRRTSLYGYYGGTYFQKNTAIDPADSKLVGYGYSGSPPNHNRAVQQITFGVSHTFWRDPQLGGLQFNTQYSYVLRHPWDPPARQPGSAQANALYLNLRYLLPGAPPQSK